MEERRSELRMAADKTVKIILIDGSVVCLGTLLDLSLLGARILVPLRIDAGKKIDLIFDGQQQRHPSTVVWNTETEIGISFDTQVPVAPAS